MANILKEIEDAGRSTDNVVGHLTVGEIVIPVQLAEIPEIRTAIEEIFKAYGVNLDEFTVGNKANKINPETGYPEFFFGKIFKAVSNAVKSAGKAITNTVKDVAKFVDNNAPHNVLARNIAALTGKSQNQQKTSSSSAPAPAPAASAPVQNNSAAFDKALAEMEKKAEEDRKRAEKEARDRAIAAESAKASGLAAENRAEVSDKLQQTLSTPIQQNAQVMPTGYNPSGYGAGEPTKAVPGTAGTNVAGGGGVQMQSPTAMPAALLAQKINQDSGGTNQQQNRFTIPKTEGLVFGGT